MGFQHGKLNRWYDSLGMIRLMRGVTGLVSIASSRSNGIPVADRKTTPIFDGPL